MARLPYWLADAFSDRVGAGNRVALIPDARGMSATEMQQVVQRLGLQAAFVTEQAGPTFWVRFFTPGGEVEFAGHAAIALALTLVRQGVVPPLASRLFFRTPMENLPVELIYDDQQQASRAVVRGPAPRFRDPPSWKLIQELTEVLGVNERYLHRGLPYGVAFTGFWSIFLPFITPGLVDEIEPEQERLLELCAALEVAAVHAYSPTGPRTYYARSFAPALGIPEDPVNGAANAALGALLARAGVVPRRAGYTRLSVWQGHRMGRIGQVDVRVEYSPAGEPQAVYLEGGAVAVEVEETL
jgi:PhzF family phenazine biosynthesis protein